MNRIEKLIPLLPPEADGVLVTSPVNRQYLTGMHATEGVVLITREGSWALMDFRYIEEARRSIRNCQVVLQEDLSRQLRELAERCGIRRLALETSYQTVGELGRFREILPRVEFLTDDRADKAILTLRQTKDEGELRAIRAAQAITDRAFSNILDFIAPGRTEREVAAELEHLMRRDGAEKTSFDTICVAGPDSSLPHGVPGDRPIRAGDFLTMDFGCMVEGYCSDMTRTVAVGHVTEEMERVYALVLEAQKAALAKAGPGVPCREVDAAARDLIYRSGFEGCFGHGTGHSVGLEIHEEPRFSPGSGAVCTPGIVMSVEPGIYLEGRFGCRIEDLILITGTGCEDLTGSPKELIIL